MLAWLSDLTARERRTMGACFGGWALDAFDGQMYTFVIPTVIALWGGSRGQAGLMGTVTFLISSLVGWFSGTLADRFGRVRMLQITILWYSIFTFLCAFAQNFEQLFVLRAARARLWRRMGSRGGADGRGDPRRIPWPRRGDCPDRLGRRLGRLGADLYCALRLSARGDRLARAICDRPVTGNLRLLDPPPHRRAGDLPRPPAHSSDGWVRPPVFRL